MGEKLEMEHRSSSLLRRRHKFKHSKSHATLAHPETYSEHVVFSMFCYVQLFFAMVAVVLAFNTGALGLQLGFSIAWGFTGLIGLVSALHASRRGLIVFICLQVVCFGFELHSFLRSLVAEAGEVCTGESTHKATLIIVLQKLYTFFFIGGACLAADHLRLALQTKVHLEDAQRSPAHMRDVSHSIAELEPNDGRPDHLPDHIPLEYLDEISAQLVASGAPPLALPPDLEVAKASAPADQ